MKRVIAGLFALPTVALACSGPGAMGAMTASHAFALSACVINIALALASGCCALMLRTGVRWPLAMLLLVCTHPAWTISVGRGDCGESARTGSVAYVAIAAVVMALQFALGIRHQKNSRRLAQSN